MDEAYKQKLSVPVHSTLLDDFVYYISLGYMLKNSADCFKSILSVLQLDA